MIKWNATRTESELIGKITKRAVETFQKHGVKLDGMSVNMDVTACHLNGCPLDLNKLLAADDFNFSHDISGIVRHINRRTGELMDCFSPRCSKPSDEQLKRAVSGGRVERRKAA